MNKTKLFKSIILCVLAVGSFYGCGSDTVSSSDDGNQTIELLNVSYDPTREFYTQINEKFSEEWKEKSGQDIKINQSHGGSGKQARSVIEGLEADVVTLALGYDIDAISNVDVIDKDWQSEFEENSAPYTSTIVFLVRKDNPKNIKDWDDLTREGVSVITPNPKTSGGARWNYLAAWAYASHKYDGDEDKIKEFMKEIFNNVEVLDSGARGATTSFVERNMGDVLIAWENEALLSLNELGNDNFEVIVPSMSILAEPPVAIVDEIVDAKGTREAAEEYIKFLYSDEGQEIAAENYYRPRNKEILDKYKDVFQDTELVTIDDEFGGWRKAQSEHFADGGTFDQIYEK